MPLDFAERVSQGASEGGGTRAKGTATGRASANQQATIARQQRQVEALTAIVRKMSEKIELYETTPQLVAE